jgi:hypothetical protein
MRRFLIGALVAVPVALIALAGCGERSGDSEARKAPSPPTLLEQYVNAKDEVEVAALMPLLQQGASDVVTEMLRELQATDKVLWRIGKVMNLARQLEGPERARVAPELDRIRVQSEYLRDVAGSLQDELKAPRFEPSSGESWDEWWQRNKLKDR